LKSRRYGEPSTAPENKKTIKVRSCGSKTPADGYKWRKYGQKCIKNNPHPRCGAVDQYILLSSYVASSLNFELLYFANRFLLFMHA
jgi:hypothetical protein